MGIRERNRWQIERYVTVLQPLLERKTGGVISLQELGQPESEPPISEAALDVIREDCNMEASCLLDPIIAEIRRSNFPRYYVLCRAGYRHGDPGAVRTWRAGVTEGARAQAAIFERTLDWIVDELARRCPGTAIRIKTTTDDEPRDSMVQVRNIDNNNLRRWTARNTYKLNYRKLRDIEEANPQMSREQAKQELIDAEHRARRDVSKRTIERAIAYCENDDDGDAA